MSHATGHRISRHNWTELPIADTAIGRVEALGVQDEQPLIQERGLVVEWRPDQLIDDDEYDHNFQPPVRALANEDHVIAALDPIDDDELDDLLDDDPLFVAAPPVPPVLPQVVPPVVPTPVVPVIPPIPMIPAVPAYQVEDVEDEDDIPFPALPADTMEDEEDDTPNANDDDEGVNDVINYDDDDDEPAREEDAVNMPDRPYNLRARKDKHGGFNDAMDNPHDGKSFYPPTQLTQLDTNIRKRLFGYAMTQMTAKARIRKFGEAALTALIQEFGQLEDQNVYEPIQAHTLTRAQRRGALRAIYLITGKRDGQINGRPVADGSTQRPLYEKHETASPTLSTDALLLSIMIDAKERRDVGTADVTGAYLNAYMTNFVIMKFTGESVDILCKMRPQYTQFVVVENGVKVLYVRLIKALYGCVKSALLWYSQLYDRRYAMYHRMVC
jgi:hypothetical protein